MQHEQMMKDLAEIIGPIVNEEVDPSNPDVKLVEDLGADSMDIVDICDRIELKFGVEIESENVKELRTLGDLASLVASKQSGAAPATEHE